MTLFLQCYENKNPDKARIHFIRVYKLIKKDMVSILGLIRK